MTSKGTMDDQRDPDETRALRMEQFGEAHPMNQLESDAMLLEALKRYPQTGGTHRQAFIEGAKWATSRAPDPVRMNTRDVNEMVRYTLIEILRRSSIIDTDDPDVIEKACAEQERIAKRIEKTVRPQS